MRFVLTIGTLLAFAIGCSESPPAAKPSTQATTQPATRAVQLSENDKIERLIDEITTMKGATFIRNGREHSGAEAAEHMRRKWNAGKDRIHTAEQFIELAASKSERSGEPYQIRLANGTTVNSSDYLREKLKQLEGSE